ncbi:hypothetical protein H1235_11370 [Pseudoxanthomonas sp. NC8]|nr:hypothetical protein H1235_11370 [Pseudoxanthomonas sp. NC8]
MTTLGIRREAGHAEVAGERGGGVLAQRHQHVADALEAFAVDVVAGDHRHRGRAFDLGALDARTDNRHLVEVGGAAGCGGLLTCVPLGRVGLLGKSQPGQRQDQGGEQRGAQAVPGGAGGRLFGHQISPKSLIFIGFFFPEADHE